MSGYFLNKKKKKIITTKRVNKFWNNICIKDESNGYKNRNLSLDEYFNKIETYLRNIIINLQKSDARKLQ